MKKFGKNLQYETTALGSEGLSAAGPGGSEASTRDHTVTEVTAAAGPRPSPLSWRARAEDFPVTRVLSSSIPLSFPGAPVKGHTESNAETDETLETSHSLAMTSM